MPNGKGTLDRTMRSAAVNHLACVSGGFERFLSLKGGDALGLRRRRFNQTFTDAPQPPGCTHPRL